MIILISFVIILYTVYCVLSDFRTPKAKPLNKQQYQNNYYTKTHKKCTINNCKDCEKAAKALSFAIETRKFEIELYWKRATYFWAFIALSFTALYNVAYSKPVTTKGILYSNLTPLAIICFGFLLSVAFYLVNKASKDWQKNWEGHIYELQENIMGPIYSIVSHKETFSVSKVNEIISKAVIALWLILFYLFFKNNPINVFDMNNETTQEIYLIFAVTTYFFSAMALFYGRTKLSKGNIKFYEAQ